MEEKEITKNKENYFRSQRRMAFLRILEIIKEKQPIGIEKLISFIEFDCGLAYKNARSMLRILFDTEKIKIDDDENITVIENDKNDV